MFDYLNHEKTKLSKPRRNLIVGMRSGKSELMREIAKLHGLPVVELSLTKTDSYGFTEYAGPEPVEVVNGDASHD